MDALDKFTAIFEFEHKEGLLWAEKATAVVFLSTLVFDIAILASLSFNTFYCIPADLDIDYLILNPNVSLTGTYIDLTCGTELSLQEWPVCLITICFVLSSVQYVLISRNFVRKLNIYDSVLSETFIEDYIGLNPVLQETKDVTRHQFKRQIKAFLRYKILAVVILFITFGAGNGVLWGLPTASNGVYPTKSFCGGENSTLYFNRPRPQFRCHSSSEWSVFMMSIGVNFLRVMMLVFAVMSFGFLKRYKNKFIGKPVELSILELSSAHLDSSKLS